MYVSCICVMHHVPSHALLGICYAISGHARIPLTAIRLSPDLAFPLEYDVSLWFGTDYLM